MGVGGVAARADGAERTILLVSKRTEEVLDLRNVTNVNVVCTRGLIGVCCRRAAEEVG